MAAEQRAVALLVAQKPRRLSEQQRRAILASLLAEPEKHSFRWTVVVSDTETDSYARSIREVFQEAGFVVGFTGFLGGQDFPHGITVNARHQELAGGVFQRALRAAKIDFTERTDDPFVIVTGVAPSIIFGTRPPAE